MRNLILLATILFSLSSLSARTWKSASGDRAFDAFYVSNDGKLVTLRKDGRILTFAIAKLHVDDQAWLKANHPLKKQEKGSNKTAVAAPKGAAFDTLEFGDARKEVVEKLSESPNVISSVPTAMIARVGLNGTFKTKQTIGGLHCYLYFDWDNNAKLKEVTLRTKGNSLNAYSGSLRSNWTELINLLTILHGDSVQGAPYPNSADLQDGLILGSHLWRTEEGHSVLLGTGQDGNLYSVVVRITNELLKVNPTG